MTTPRHLASPWVVVVIGAMVAGIALTRAAEIPALRIVPAEIDAVFAGWDKPGSPGAALAVIHDGRIVYERGYGRANLENDIPITPQTAFYVGSVSKQFTAACIALLALDGTIALDDDVRKYVPELPDYGARITLRQLLHHTSGLRDYLALRDLAGEPADGTFDDADVLSLLIRQKALNFPPGSEYLYSNSGYFLLSLVIKRTTGKTLREFANTKIFQPLGMTTAGFRDDHTSLVKNRAEGYAPGGGNGFRLSNPNFDVVGAGGLFMTVRDFLAWDENFYVSKVGGRAWIDLLQTPGTFNNGQNHGYAFGLMIGTFRGLRIVEHSGAYGGFRAHVLRFPDQRFSIVCFTNLSTMVPGQLARKIAALCLGEARFVSPGVVAEKSGSPKAKAGGKAGDSQTSSPTRLEEFVGAFVSDELNVTFQVRRLGDRLTLQRGNRSPLPMEAEGPDVFRAGTTKLRFQRDSPGAAAAFALDAGRVRDLVFTRQP